MQDARVEDYVVDLEVGNHGYLADEFLLACLATQLMAKCAEAWKSQVIDYLDALLGQNVADVHLTAAVVAPCLSPEL